MIVSLCDEVQLYAIVKRLIFAVDEHFTKTKNKTAVDFLKNNIFERVWG